MEIYNEKVNDLLDIKKKNLKLHEDMNGQVVVDVEERVCKSSHEASPLLKDILRFLVFF